MGGFLVYMILNLIAKNNYFSLYHTICTLGYSMVPISFLALLGVFVTLKYHHN